MLRALREVKLLTRVRFCQASSGELFGNTSQSPQNETTAFAPVTPYGTAKLYAYCAVRAYRENYNMHASNGILFNYESPARGENFVTQKNAQAVAHVASGGHDVLKLGNLSA